MIGYGLQPVYGVQPYPGDRYTGENAIYIKSFILESMMKYINFYIGTFLKFGLSVFIL